MVDRVWSKTTAVTPARLPESRSKPAYPQTAEQAPLFQELLAKLQQTQKLTFSAHARERMESRQISFREEDIDKITEAVNAVEAKGGRSSLLLYGEIALLANIPNRTIITAVDGAGEREQIFTGIDSAVIFK